jgi:hypothetical protein
MGSHYVYKVFRKIKIVKYSKIFYYFNLTKYFVNTMGSH